MIKEKFISVYRFYRDGFKEMTWGRTLWAIILIKLFVMFFILKLFFFPSFLKGKSTEEKLELEIEMNDERNIALSNAAMASGFKVLSVVLAAAIVILAYAGQLNAAACLIIIGAYFVGQITFIAKLWYLHKNF